MLSFPAAQVTELPIWAEAFLLYPVMLGTVSGGPDGLNTVWSVGLFLRGLFSALSALSSLLLSPFVLLVVNWLRLHTAPWTDFYVLVPLFAPPPHLCVDEHSSLKQEGGSTCVCILVVSSRALDFTPLDFLHLPSAVRNCAGNSLLGYLISTGEMKEKLQMRGWKDGSWKKDA